jgi:hypothetical protein
VLILAGEIIDAPGGHHSPRQARAAPQAAMTAVAKNTRTRRIRSRTSMELARVLVGNGRRRVTRMTWRPPPVGKRTAETPLPAPAKTGQQPPTNGCSKKKTPPGWNEPAGRSARQSFLPLVMEKGVERAGVNIIALPQFEMKWPRSKGYYRGWFMGR